MNFIEQMAEDKAAGEDQRGAAVAGQAS